MLNIDNAETLIQVIRGIQRVSPTLKDRTKEQVEWMTLSYFLTAHTSDLHYPFVIRKTESPDFILDFPEASWGTEVTEAIHPDYNRLRALLERESPEPWFIDSSHFKWGTPKKSLAELKALALQTELSGLPWMGNSVEEEFSAMLKEVVAGKATKLGTGEYQKCDRNILLIYSNQSLPQLNIEEGASIAKEVLRSAAGGFDVVSVVKGVTLIEFSEGQSLLKLIPKIE
ncbi:hypothetical protein CKQ84_08135 [Shewanella sp. WE21]|uniref:hypothetical protein n=1 Tax=Shewanella sp. WE21 TaxID=2029986 RepID=UPI000CF6F2C7|nr:hypothetical protein [Shewanella sp. WE21]AVI65854.1 hypothetical protein CKQ84_08135 [Shewanella sp. WE21]